MVYPREVYGWNTIGTRSKSVLMSEDGEKLSKELFTKYFSPES
jgi:hypothetical protein